MQVIVPLAARILRRRSAPARFFVKVKAGVERTGNWVLGHSLEFGIWYLVIHSSQLLVIVSWRLRMTRATFVHAASSATFRSLLRSFMPTASNISAAFGLALYSASCLVKRVSN